MVGGHLCLGIAFRFPKNLEPMKDAFRKFQAILKSLQMLEMELKRQGHKERLRQG